jgi:hypothetical protein
MTITNPSTLPDKQIYSKCKLGDIYQQPTNGLYFCNLCRIISPCTLHVHIKTTIQMDDV